MFLKGTTTGGGATPSTKKTNNVTGDNELSRPEITEVAKQLEQLREASEKDAQNRKQHLPKPFSEYTKTPPRSAR
jgi:hypothetical protein